MGIGETLSKEIQAWGVLAIVVVIISVVLLKFKSANVGDITCPGASETHNFFNASSNLCCLGNSFTNVSNCASGNTSAIGNVASTLDTFVGAFSEPKNWVAIVIIALIGFAILKLFTKKK